jgi:hypothetical protein
MTVAISVPFLAGRAAGKMPGFAALMERDTFFLAAVEVFTAATVIVFFYIIRRARQDRQLASIARRAGLVPVDPSRGLKVYSSKRKANNMKTKSAFAREIMIIGSTGNGTFAEPGDDLYEALLQCREAKIMLLDPREHGAFARANSIPDPEITPEAIREQVIKSIDFIKNLRASEKKIRLKLYPDMPLLKIAILGDHVSVRHYHTGLNVRYMPEFVFKNTGHHGGLYLPMYRYFLSRWQDPDIPEYDLDTDELIYHDHLGYEVLREPFHEMTVLFDEKQKDAHEEDLRSRYVFR